VPIRRICRARVARVGRFLLGNLMVVTWTSWIGRLNLPSVDLRFIMSPIRQGSSQAIPLSKRGPIDKSCK
jgi:hypothetical protein